MSFIQKVNATGKVSFIQKVNATGKVPFLQNLLNLVLAKYVKQVFSQKLILAKMKQYSLNIFSETLVLVIINSFMVDHANFKKEQNKNISGMDRCWKIITLSLKSVFLVLIKKNITLRVCSNFTGMKFEWNIWVMTADTYYTVNTWHTDIKWTLSKREKKAICGSIIDCITAQ